MRVIRHANKQVIQTIGSEHKITGETYKLSKFCIVQDNGNTLLIYNDLTKAMIEVGKEEYHTLTTDNDNKTSLFRDRFLVNVNTNEDLLADELIDEIRRQSCLLRDLSSYTIFPTTGCNARCFYCYEKGRNVNAMSIETADKVIRYILEHTPQEQKITLRWFGGEPLFNYKVIDYICEGIKKSGREYVSTMISNGYIFTAEMAQRAKDLWKLSSVQITLDGTEEVYNKTKSFIYKNAEISPFKKVIGNIHSLIEQEIKVSVRMNLDMHNAEDLLDLVEYLNQEFPKNRYYSMYVYPLFETNAPRTDEERMEVFEKLYKVEDKLQKVGYGSGGRKISSSYQTHQCMADSGNSITILPKGDIGLCEHFSDDDFIGHIDREGFDTEKIKEWKERIGRLPICEDCPIYPSCLRLKKCEEQNICNNAKKQWRLDNVRKSMTYLYRDSIKKAQQNNSNKMVVTPTDSKQ